MTENEKKIELVEAMIENGWHLMNRTIESMCEDFTVEDLQYMLKRTIERK